MKRIILNRFFQNEHKTLGEMHLMNGNTEEGKLFTLELPDLDNKKGISCIPEGEYKAIPIKRASNNKWALWLQDVPNRTAILIHSGNYTWHIQGCILVGLGHDDINNDGITDVMHSTKAMKILEGWMKGEFEVQILIQNKRGDLDPKTEHKV